ncbi:Ubiquitin-conjugating enzyme family protein [Cryptosporidium felis]|nr:Ubiquitin-conjugating enzyme family protein [Cryptosporidium felis]
MRRVWVEMMNKIYGAISGGTSILKGSQTQDSGLDEIHRNRIKNEVEQLKLNQCKQQNCRELVSHDNRGMQPLHYHINNVVMYDRENRRNYVLLEISLMVEDSDSFLSSEIPIQVILYKDFPFNPPDIIFPSTFCFPSLSDGRSFTAEILNDWSPSITLLAVVECAGSYRSPISFPYQCYNSLTYPVLCAKVRFEDHVFEQMTEKSLSKGQNAISQKGKSLFLSLIPIPLNTRGLRRETMSWRFERPCINIDFVFNITNVMLFDTTLLIIESSQKTPSIGSGSPSDPSKTSSSSDEVPSDSTLHGTIAFWLFLPAISHIIDCNGKVIFGNQGTLPDYISEKLGNLEYSECLVLVLGYDPVCEKSPLSFYYYEDLLQLPRDSKRPTVIELKFHTEKARHESSCCMSFAANIKEKVLKLDPHFPQNCHNPRWDSHFEVSYLSNLNDRYQEAILGNHVHLSSEIIQRWVVICSKLIEQSSFLSESDEKYAEKSSILVRQMQDVLVSPVVKNILNAEINKHKVPNIDQNAQNDVFYNNLEHYSPTAAPNPESPLGEHSQPPTSSSFDQPQFGHPLSDEDPQPRSPTRDARYSLPGHDSLVPNVLVESLVAADPPGGDSPAWNHNSKPNSPYPEQSHFQLYESSDEIHLEETD